MQQQQQQQYNLLPLSHASPSKYPEPTTSGMQCVHLQGVANIHIFKPENDHQASCTGNADNLFSFHFYFSAFTFNIKDTGEHQCG
jgi:hypothetical protein